MSDSLITFPALSLIFALLLGSPLIKFLKTLNAKQTIREDGPSHHITEKSKIPTIGGLIFLLPVLILSIIFIYTEPKYEMSDLKTILLVTFLMGSLGFVDDFLKVLKKHNKGISGWVKLFIQFCISILLFFIYKEYDEGIIYLLWVFFVIAGASNSYNLTDGLDGLLAGISICSFLGFCFLLITLDRPELVIFCLIFTLAIVGFLFFNKYPAKVFMGDTGSLAIGGAIGSIAIATRSELFLLLFATIPIIEAVSVILQVLSFKLSKKFLNKDKRLFKMAPLHHHFELCGWSEVCITKRFIIFQLFYILVGMLVTYLIYINLAP